jgi:hypothetical protein
MKDGYKVAIIAVVAFTLAALPILYFLSSGPVFLLAKAGYLSNEGYQAIYGPLIHFCDSSLFLQRIWNSYQRYWH